MRAMAAAAHASVLSVVCCENLLELLSWRIDGECLVALDARECEDLTEFCESLVSQYAGTRLAGLQTTMQRKK